MILIGVGRQAFPRRCVFRPNRNWHCRCSSASGRRRSPSPGWSLIAVYGGNLDLRTWLEAHGYWYVLAVACDEPVGIGRLRDGAGAWKSAK